MPRSADQFRIMYEVHGKHMVVETCGPGATLRFASSLPRLSVGLVDLQGCKKGKEDDKLPRITRFLSCSNSHLSRTYISQPRNIAAQ